MWGRGAVLSNFLLHYPRPPKLQRRTVPIYVEKTVAGKPMSLVGPFANLVKANSFIEEAWKQEKLHAYAILRAKGHGYRDVCYSIIDHQPNAGEQ